MVSLGAILLAGCASIDTTIKKDWSAEVGSVDKAVTDPNGKAIVLHKPEGFMKKGGLVVLDGETGHPLAHEDIAAASLMDEGFYIGDTKLSDIKGKDYDFYYLPDFDLLLVMNSSVSNTEIHCVDLTSGKNLWTTTDLRWSLENFAGIGKAVAKGVANSLGFGAGLATNAASSELTRPQALSRLIIPVPELHAFLFKTLGELNLIEARTGKILWTAENVPGSGFTHMRYVPETNDLLLITMSTSLINSESAVNKLVRINAENGKVLWTVDYAGRDDMIQGLYHQGNYVLLSYQGGMGEVINYETGKEVLKTKDDMENSLGKLFKNSIINQKMNAAPVFLKDAVCAAQISDVKVVGYPDWVVQKFNLRSGKMIWESTPLQSKPFVSNLQIDGGLVVVTSPRGDHQILALDAESGKTVWDFSPDGTVLTNVLAENGRLYAGTEKTLFQIDIRSGKVLKKVDFGANGIGKPRQIQKEGGELAVISGSGVAYYSSPAMNRTKVLEFPMSQSHPKIEGNELVTYMFSWGKYKGLALVDLPDKTIDGYLKFQDDMKNVPDHPQLLRNGFYVTHTGDAVFVLNDGTLVRYAL